MLERESDSTESINYSIYELDHFSQCIIIISDSLLFDDVHEKYYLNLGFEPFFIVYPDGGNTNRGMYTFHDLVNAYDHSLPVEITGFSYLQEMNGTQYPIFYVNRIEIMESKLLPLSTNHNRIITLARIHYIFTDSSFVYFPVSFRFGYDTYPEGNGTMEHYYLVSLNSGENVYYNYSSSVLTRFGVYFDPYTNVFSSFHESDSNDFIFHLTDYSKAGTLKATQEGYYAFSFRATDKSETFFNLYRIK